MNCLNTNLLILCHTFIDVHTHKDFRCISIHIQINKGGTVFSDQFRKIHQTVLATT